MISFVDFETRSMLNLTNVGLWRYAQHKSTYPLMLAYTTSRGIEQWREYEHGRACPASWRALVDDPRVVFHAHNAAFEITIYDEICHRRWGWPAIPLSRWRCTAAKASHANQPRSLSKVCERVSVPEAKDKSGKFLISKLSMPQVAVKTKRYASDAPDGRHKRGDERTDSVAWLQAHNVPTFSISGCGRPRFWNNDPQLLHEFAEYNKQDVVAERSVDEALPLWSEAEQRVWLLDQQINARGIPIDREFCEGAIRIYEMEMALCNARLREIVGSSTTKPITAISQSKRILEWINERVNFGASLDKNVVIDWLKKPWGVHRHSTAYEPVREVLTLRLMAGGTAIKKYWAALNWMQGDGRCRGQMLYHGAATGRWTGKGIQPHNMIRQAIPDDIFFRAIADCGYDEVRQLAELFGYTVMQLLTKCVRGMICAPPGKKLVISDFAGIEARVLQWLAGNERALQLFRDGADMYVHAASQIFDLSYDDMMVWSEADGELVCDSAFKDKRQIGKIAVLALGYGMGAAKYQETCENAGTIIDETFAKSIVVKWREANPEVVKLWRRLERACKAVIQNKKIVARLDDKFRIYWDKRGYLCIRLPSGRVLYYYRAKLGPETEFGRQIMYLDGSKNWVSTYGGCLAENVTQAVSRDLLVHAMQRSTDENLTVIFHVHDELVCEEDEGNEEAAQQLQQIMTTLPAWAGGLPIAAKTYESKRYTKE